MKSLLSLLLIVATLPVLAGQHVGNGGDGYIVDANTVHLLDLVEAGAEHEPRYAGLPAQPKVVAQLRGSLGFMSDEELELLASKLAEIAVADPLFARILRRLPSFFSWSLVTPSLVNIPDEDTNLEIDPKQLVQLAIRRGSAIRINREAWAKLPLKHRPALILHEIIYAIVPPTRVYPESRARTYLTQESYRARDLVGHLFTSPLGKGSLKPFTYFPVGVETDGTVVDTEDGVSWAMKLNVGRNFTPSPKYPIRPGESAKIPGVVDTVCSQTAVSVNSDYNQLFLSIERSAVILKAAEYYFEQPDFSIIRKSYVSVEVDKDNTPSFGSWYVGGGRDCLKAATPKVREFYSAFETGVFPGEN